MDITRMELNLCIVTLETNKIENINKRVLEDIKSMLKHNVQTSIRLSIIESTLLNLVMDKQTGHYRRECKIIVDKLNQEYNGIITLE